MTQEKKEEMLKKNLETILALEAAGIRFENPIGSKEIIYKYSVPEKSIIGGEEFSADSLKKEAKDALINLSIDACKLEGFLDDGDKEWVKSQIKCYAKVRKGEIWTEEMGKARVEELTEQLKSAIEYLEV